MNLLRKLLNEGRVREARRRLSAEATPLSYAQLAQEHAKLGDARAALAVCEEGLTAFPGSADLARLADRARGILREGRIAELKTELAQAPRPALWRELAELYLESGQVGKAEEQAQAWLRRSGDSDAQLMYARALSARFLADRGREAGQRAFDALDEAARRASRDARVFELRLDLCERIGAISDALQAATTLLELTPGQAELEARHRRLAAQADASPTIEQALREVEKSGVLRGGGEAEPAPVGRARDLRPTLQRLAAQDGVEAALYVRGSTALVQGPKGATAERTARATRALLQHSRASARRLGLGQVMSLRLEGSFGTLSVAAGELDAGALWTRGPLAAHAEALLLELAGSDTDCGGAQ
jgi:tetratricopeptide (TPR) repeat protein